MAKQPTMKTKKDKLERLNNREFCEYLPHLELHELYLLEIKRDTEWIHLFDVCYNEEAPEAVVCNVCYEKLTFTDFGKHLRKSTHENALKKVTQFFHPIYTYGKRAEKLANAEAVSSTQLRKSLFQAKTLGSKILETDMAQALLVAKVVQSQGTDNDSNDFEKILSSLVLETEAKIPENMFALVRLSLTDLLEMEYKDATEQWKPMLTTNKPHVNSRFNCAICKKFCSGILTVNSHFSGHLHKMNQLNTLGVRVPSYPQLTKNCSYSFDNKYSLVIKEEARTIFKEEVEEIIKSGKSYQYVLQKLGDTISKEQDVVLSAVSNAVAAKAKLLKDNCTNLVTTHVNSDSDIFSEGLIGVEYVVKLMKTPNDTSPMYECCLCEVVLNEARMQGHLIGYNHRLKYCTTHYPDTIEKYKDLIGHEKYTVFYSTMGYILSKVALEIEKHHGRSAPCVVPWSKFIKKRNEIIARLFGMRHACQQHGPSFSNCVTLQQIFELKKHKHSYKPPIVPPNHNCRFILKDTEKSYLGQREVDLKLVWNDEDDVHSINRENKKSDGKFTHNNEMWKKYREQLSVATREVESQYNEYRTNPESHPLYDMEWTQFWKRRKEELIAQGINHRSYNYQPDWVHFFRQRLEELYKEDLHESKLNIRKDFNMPSDAEENSSSIHGNNGNMLNIPKKKSNSNVGNIAPPEKKPRLNSKRDSDANSTMQLNSWDNQSLTTPAAPSNLVYSKTGAPRSEISLVDDGKPNVIHVLRLLTALEEHLGSLGVKVMDLLSKALVLEKKYINSPKELEQSILSATSCTLLETAMEKLKGIVFAGLLENSKVQGFERVINHTADLLNYAAKMEWRNVDYSENIGEMDTILNVIQKKSQMFSGGQKSLSDTLIDLLTQQRKDSLKNTDADKRMDPMNKPFHNTLSGNRSFDGLNSGDNYNQNSSNIPQRRMERSNFGNVNNLGDKFNSNMSNPAQKCTEEHTGFGGVSLGTNYSSNTFQKQTDLSIPKGSKSQGNFNSSGLDALQKREEIFQQRDLSCPNLKSFDTKLDQNVSSFRFVGKSFHSNANNGHNAGGSGRNSFNTLNNINQNNNRSSINNVNMKSNFGNGLGGNVPSSRPQFKNTNLPDRNWMPNDYNSSIGASNWKELPNTNRSWSTNQQFGNRFGNM